MPRESADCERCLFHSSLHSPATGLIVSTTGVLTSDEKTGDRSMGQEVGLQWLCLIPDPKSEILKS